jgi:hypothetical protein
MRTPTHFLTVALLGVLFSSSALAVDPDLKPIFNGHDLRGWQSAGAEGFWRAEDGVLIGESDEALTGNYLRSEKSYGDFVLEFEVRWTGEIDSGIEFRDPALQLQLGVSRSLQRDMSGSFYVTKVGYPEAGQSKEAAKLMHPDGAWNTFRIRAEGPVFTVWINGVQSVQFTDEKFPGAAPLAIQIHAKLKMKVEYRNIRLAAM